MNMELQDLDIEWDEEKNEINKRKHHVSFETASTCFSIRSGLKRLMIFIAMTKTDIRWLGVSGRCCLLFTRNVEKPSD